MAVGTFGSVVDYGSVGVALPSIAGHFGADIPTVQWVVIGFAVTVIALLLPMGRLADLIGLKRVYIMGGLVFIAGALAAGLAPSLLFLALARVVQGVGAAMAQGTGMAIVIAAFPPSERGKAIGLIMTMVGAGAIAGPALGGALVDALGWRSVFYANIPIVALSVATGMAVLRNHREDAAGGAGRGRFDWPGAAMSSGALVLFLVAITNAHRAGWTSPLILAAAAGVAALLAVFVWWELRRPNPMLQLRFFRRRNFSLGGIGEFFDVFGVFGGVVYDAVLLAECPGLQPAGCGFGGGAGRALHGVGGAVERAVVGPFRVAQVHGGRVVFFGGGNFHTVAADGRFVTAHGGSGVDAAKHGHGGVLLAEHQRGFERGGAGVLRGGFGVLEPDSQRGERHQHRRGYGGGDGDDGVVGV